MLPFHDAHERAVPRGEIEKVVGRGQTARARHVLHDDGRSAGDVTADVARHGAGIDVVPAARRRSDHYGDRLARVEIRNIVSGGSDGRPGRRNDKGDQQGIWRVTIHNRYSFAGLCLA